FPSTQYRLSVAVGNDLKTVQMMLGHAGHDPALASSPGRQTWTYPHRLGRALLRPVMGAAVAMLGA
ncbi:MAG: hypothetical protein LC749_12655, partial [Actinobacteria bacterium]|nr:hypothetical protein [Actinomycetota bacterium]